MSRASPGSTESARETHAYIDLETEGTVDEMIGKALARKEDMAKTVVDDWRAYFE